MISIDDAKIAIITAKDMMILIGNPITKRLNCGIVFMSIPKIISAIHESAIIGKAMVKPMTNIFAEACII